MQSPGSAVWCSRLSHPWRFGHYCEDSDLIRRAGIGRNGPLRAVAQQKLMWEALREAVDEEMEADPTVCLMGMFTS